MSDLRARQPVKGVLYRVACLLYLYFWIHRARIRGYFERGSLIVLAIYVVVLGAEVLLEVRGAEWGKAPQWTVKAVFWVLIGFALFTKVREWNAHRQELYFIQAAQKVADLMSRSTDVGEAAKQVMAIALGAFRSKKTIRATLTLKCDDGLLRVDRVEPDHSVLDWQLALKPGQGGAGYAYDGKCVVYIPRRKMGNAVVQNFDEDRPYHLVEDLYVPDAVEEFKSVLSVPLLMDGECHGVLNFDSSKNNAFRRIDFQQAMFFAFALAHLLQRDSITRN